MLAADTPVRRHLWAIPILKFSTSMAFAVNLTRRGPLRFEEGVATDTDIPNDFGLGAYGDTQGDGRGRPILNVKDPADDDA